MQKIDLSIPRKKGPFYLRKLTLAEALDFISKVSAMTRDTQVLTLVQKCLVNADGKAIYSPQQKGKMETDLGGVKLALLSLQVEKLNEFSAFANLDDTIEAAEKN